MCESDEKTDPDADRLERAEKLLRVATQLARFTKQVVTLGLLIA